ncbi:sensor histidine kinase [Xylophilus sp.]|uniref:sensor histidine kinase n=1 Tax=Xylophilus sp. TaxID=2653893 RepID=UPI0013B66B7C|nr:histidine kinase [Xylophilus sp.]KAF1043777.1 MAG: Sensor histidine kinase YpdA [Xylophilus sp.]
MNESPILSTPHPRPPARADGPALVFDACHAGVILRAVLFVELVLAVGALFGSGNAAGWLLLVAMLTGGALPATLAWIVACCSAKRLLQRLPTGGQYGAGVALGALAGLYACAMLGMMDVAADPPPWLAGACAGALLAALLVAALLLRARARTPAATAARLSELQARIRPHFLFNTLNRAIALVRAEPARAEALLEDLSDLFRHALADRGDAATLEEELQLAERYLAIEQTRFGVRLRVDWALDPAAGEARLPPLLLQPLVENAVKHGVEPDAAGGWLRIATERRGSQVVVAIDNSLPEQAAAPRAPGHGIALANVRERLRLLHDVEVTFDAGPQRDGSWRARIVLPADAPATARPAEAAP